MGKFRQINNCHSHSDGSLDGAATIKQIVKRNLELGATAVAATEHGNMNTAMTLYHTCKEISKKGTKVLPILGIELYIESPFLEEERRRLLEKNPLPSPTAVEEYDKAFTKIEKKLRESYVHLTIHFKDEWAYNYFCRLTPSMESRAVTRWGERKPICTFEELAGASGHITVCSGCIGGAVMKWVAPFKSPLTGEYRIQPELAERAYLQLRKIAGKDNFFVEIFPHALTHDWKRPVEQDGKIVTPGQFVPNECNPFATDGDAQKVCNQFVLQMARKYGDRVLISLDSHFATPSQKLIQNAKLGNGENRWQMYGSYHLMPTDEAAEVLKATLGVDDREIESWVDNSYAFADLFKDFKLTTCDDRWILLPLPENWQLELKHKIDKYGRMNWNDPVMVDRLKMEIRVLACNGKLNMMAYVFPVEDISNYCKNNDILMNCRGSAGGSLLLYLLGISAVNPLKHGLIFERFLTEGRLKANTLPDVDMDFSDRDKVIRYLESKYGDCAMRLSTDMLLRLKSSIKDTVRAAEGKVPFEIEKLCAMLPTPPQGTNDKEFVFGFDDDAGVHHMGLLDTDENLKAFAATSPYWNTVVEMMGIQRSKSTHACYSADTLILTKEGDRVEYSRIDQCNQKTIMTGQGNQARALLIPRGKKKTVKYLLENGLTVRATPDHPILTTRGWLPIHQAFEEGADLICPLPTATQQPEKKGRPMKIMSAIEYEEEDVFDLSVDHADHSFQLVAGLVAHNCGFLLTDRPVSEYFPVIKVAGEMAVGFNPKSVEQAGGVKMDLLGLSTLRDIELCLRSIKLRLGITLNPWDLPYDPECFKQFGLGNTVGVFQFDSPTIRPFLVATKPSQIEHLCGLTALGRPGTLDAPSGDGRTLATVYVDRWNGEPIEYVHPDLEPILKHTMGVALYQEQSLQIFRDIGGMSYEEAETARRGIGKKDAKVLATITAKLAEACVKRGWSTDQVNLLVDQINASARYSFNKSHAMSYAYVAYTCMYLKTNYPLDWWKAVLTNASKVEIATKLWQHVKSFTDMPDINRSQPAEYEIIAGNRLIAPLSIIKGVGDKMYESLCAGRPYVDLRDFISKNLGKRPKGERNALNMGIACKLVAAGSLDSLFPSEISDPVDKLHHFLKVRAEVREEKVKPADFPDEYREISTLGKYMIKKQLISIYSQDLRPVMLPQRGGKDTGGNMWWLACSKTRVMDGCHYWTGQRLAEEEKLGDNDELAFIGFVIEEKAKPYANKKKRATDLHIDINGVFVQEILWPDFESNTAESGFKGLPCLIYYQPRYSKRAGKRMLALKKVVPLLTKEDLEKYNMR